ncbi:MAG TPA: histidine phosphatase family protein [Chloroflexota bacterium]|nr:histidine phosphatase family protein [Chloroflexota bacterium]
MDLYILRHAEAGEARRDEDRELTQRGREQARAVADGIGWLDLKVGAILSSPLPRAAQTAEPVAAKLGLSVTLTDGLAAGQSPQAALSALNGRSERVLLVGHEPQLSGIVEALTGGRIHMRKAMLAYVEVQSLEPAYGELAWLLSWRHLERLGR